MFEKRWGAKFPECDFYLNTITKRDADGYFNLSQPAHAKELVRKHNMEHGRKVTTPLVPGTNVAKDQCARLKEENTNEKGVSSTGHGVSNAETPAPKATIKIKKGKAPKPRKSAASERQAKDMRFLNFHTEMKYTSGLFVEGDFADADVLVGPNLT